MQELAADLAKIKRHAHSLEEENTRLKGELARLTGQEQDEPDTGGKPEEVGGMGNLINLYDRGFHICNLYFGGIRNGDCLFCAAFMQRDRR